MRTYTVEDEERFNQVLRDIQASVPAAWRRNAVVDMPFTPTIKMVMEKALESDTIDPEKKRQIKNLLDSGQVSKMVSQEDPKYTRQIEQFVNREISKAIKAGRLPPKSHAKYLPSLIKMRENEEKARKEGLDS